MEAVYPRKTTLPSMPVMGSFKHLSLYKTSSKFSGRLIRLSFLSVFNKLGYHVRF